MYLLDTNVVSELRKKRPHGAVIAWLEARDDAELFISAVTLGELQAGVELTRKQDKPKADQIEGWIQQIAQTWQVLSMDVPAFREWAKLMHGQPDSLTEDAMIAATARVHRLKVVTRNAKDFQRFNVPVVNPFSSPL
jgi:predicted nucleic acid-binding protein